MNRIDKDYGLTDRFETIYTHGKCLVFAFAFNDIYRSGKFCQFYDKKCPVHIAVVINDEIYDAGGLVTPESINERYRADLTPVFMEQKEFDFFFGSIDLQDKGEIEAAKIFCFFARRKSPMRRSSLGFSRVVYNFIILTFLYFLFKSFPIAAHSFQSNNFLNTVYFITANCVTITTVFPNEIFDFSLFMSNDIRL